MSSSPAPVQPGWYDDPQTPGTLRWHDGEAWSPFTKASEVADGPAPARPAATTALAARPSPDRTVPAADRAPAVVPTPHRDPAPTWPAAPTDEWPPAAATRAAPAAPLPLAVPSAASPTPPPAALPRAVTPGAGVRAAVGRLADRLPGWLPGPVAGPLSRRMARYAAGSDRPREGITGLVRRLAFPADGAWEASTAALLGLLTVALAVWPLVGAGVWLVTCAFAGLAFRRLRHDVLLGGVERAWFGIACGVAPLWTGLLTLAFR